MNPFDPNDPRQRQMYERYIQAQDNDQYDDIDDDEVAGNIQQFMRQAPPEMQQQVYNDYFQRLPVDQRQQLMGSLPPQYQQMMDPNDPRMMAQGFHQAAQRQVDPTPESPLEQIFSRGGALSSPLAKAALVGLAGVIGSKLLGRR